MPTENQHYVPRVHFKRFQGDDNALFELDKTTQKIERRALDSAGSIENLYPPETERGIMQQLDNRAWPILNAIASGRRDAIVTDDDKLKLTPWLAMFTLRVPFQWSFCEQSLQQSPNQKETQIKLVMSKRNKYVQQYREFQPAYYAQLVKEHGSKSRANDHLILVILRSIQTDAIDVSLSSKDVFHFMLTNETFRANYQREIDGMTWRWLRTANAFVIGDNPLCRKQAGQTNNAYNYGLSHPDVELTFPVSRNLCLRLDRSSDPTTERQLSADETAFINRLQAFSAVRYAWGPTVAVLEESRPS